MKKAALIFITLFLSFVTLVSCSGEPPQSYAPNYVDMQTDIAVSYGSAESYLERDGYGFTVSRLSVTVDGKKAFTDIINAELEEWLQYGIETCDTVITEEANGDRVYRLVSSVTYSGNGLLSLRCSVDYSEYGETVSRTLKSAVWDVGREERVTARMMLKMSDADYENLLTMNLSPIVSERPDAYPKYLVNGAGKYSLYTDYYINDNGLSLYTLNNNIKYSIEGISFRISFKQLSELFNYDISTK